MVSRAGRGIAWSIAIALLVNLLTVMPLMLRMAVANDMTMAAGCPMQGMSDKGNPGHHPLDHSHCLVCTGGIGAATLAANIAPPAPALVTVAPLRESPAPFPSRGLRTAYISRAPPLA
jgi:hypothetical protein